MTDPNSGNEPPYDSSEIRVRPERSPPIERFHWRPLFVGAAWSICSAFPLTALLALVFRFTVPLIGYLSGIEAIIPAMVAVLIYGILLGGFILIGGLGAFVAFLLNMNSVGNVKNRKWIVAILTVSTSFVCLLLLATLDKFIRPW